MTAPVQTHLEKIEAGIVSALKGGGLSSRFLISAFPDKPEEFDMGDAEKVVLVQYTGSRFDAPVETGGAAQMRHPVFAIHIHLTRVDTRVRGLREIEQIRLVLQGLNLEGTRLRIIRDGLADQNGARWHYLLEVSCTIPALPITPVYPSPFINDFSKEGA